MTGVGSSHTSGSEAKRCDLLVLATDRARAGRSGHRCEGGGGAKRSAGEGEGVAHDDVGTGRATDGEGGAASKVSRDERDAAAPTSTAAPATAFAAPLRAAAGAGAFAMARCELRAIFVDATVPI